MNRAQRRNISKSRDYADIAGLAEFYQRNGRLDEAKQKYREAIALNPASVEAHNNLGLILQDTGHAAEATAQFARAFKIAPVNARIAFSFARALAAQNRYQESATLFREAISLDALEGDAHFGLALCLAQLGQHHDAEQSYLKGLQIDPSNWQARASLGIALVDQGKIVDAFAQADILARAAETAAGFPHKSFGILLTRAGCPDGARVCFETHLSLNPADKDEIAMLLAAVGGALPDRASDRQVEQLYASRAAEWDQGATGPTGYRGHRLVVAAIDELHPGRVDTIIDAGCGTGLVGELIRAKAGHLVGVDMSQPMLALARQKNIYDELHCGDLLEYLASHPRSCDIVASAATLIHFGDLDPVFDAAAKCLRPGGLLACTLFPNDDDPDAVTIGALNGFAQGGCFRHGTGHVTRAAAKHGFVVKTLRQEAHEYVSQSPISGLVVVLRLA
jgi:predicted TPR repeat methyltransferase